MSLDKWLYNFARRQTTQRINITGESRTIGGTAVTVHVSDSTGVTVCSGTTVPTAAGAGYAKGCTFRKTDAAAGASGSYTNMGTVTACKFVQDSPIPYVLSTATISAATTNATLTTAVDGKNVTNTGSGAAVTLTLPAASTMISTCFRTYATTANIIDLKPATGEAIGLAGSAAASKYLRIPAVVGNYADVYCDGTTYHVVNYSGALIKEA